MKQMIDDDSYKFLYSMITIWIFNINVPYSPLLENYDNRNNGIIHSFIIPPVRFPSSLLFYHFYTRHTNFNFQTATFIA